MAQQHRVPDGLGVRLRARRWLDAARLVQRHAEWCAAPHVSKPAETVHEGWAAARRLHDAHSRFMAACHAPLAALLARSEERLVPALRPDPLREAWHRFRPLRLSREEDWADWLAHLLERVGQPLTGVGVYALFLATVACVQQFHLQG